MEWEETRRAGKGRTVGHDVYITRAPHYLDGAQVPIDKRDWRALAGGDPELTVPDPSVPDFVVWTGPTAAQNPWIDLVEGNLFSRSPDHSFVRKLIDIAGRLGARVQGEGGELYRIEGGLVVLEEPEPEEPEPDPEPTAPPDPEVERLFHEARLSELLDEALPDEGDAAPATGGEDPDANASFVRAPDEVLAREQGGRAPGVSVPFRIGQRVRTPWGRLATVVEIDRGAELGMGSIEIKYEDGTTATMSCVAHGLEPA